MASSSSRVWHELRDDFLQWATRSVYVCNSFFKVRHESHL
jgi:hypothetical protein